MIERFLKEVLVFLGATLFFLLLCATVGISKTTRKPAPVVAAEEIVTDSEIPSVKESPSLPSR